jgi:hypothetical protein
MYAARRLGWAWPGGVSRLAGRPVPSRDQGAPLGAVGAPALFIGALLVLGSVLAGMPRSFVPGLTVPCNPLQPLFGKTGRSSEIEPV